MLKQRTSFLLTLALVPWAMVSVTHADQDPPATPQAPQAPKGYVLVDEETWHKLADEPGHHFERAREAYLKTELRHATTELRKAGAHLRIAAAHATVRTKGELIHAEHAIEHLAKRVEAGTVKSVDEFDIVSSRALHSLADYQYVRAADAWRHHEERVAGQYLRSAGQNLEKASARAGTAIRDATAEVVHNTRVLSGRMIEGTEYVMDEVGAGFEAFGRQMERVGKAIMPTQTGSR